MDRGGAMARARRGSGGAARGDARAAGARPRRGLPAPDVGNGRPGRGPRSRHLHVARDHEIALLAAGAGVDAVERVMGGSHATAFALVRPPGHHAERDRAMGFCLYNNVAVAAAHARALGARRSPSSTTTCTTATARSTSSTTTRRAVRVAPPVPVLPGHRRGRRGRARRGRWLHGERAARSRLRATRTTGSSSSRSSSPSLTQFEPEIVLVSAGFDAHERDPLGGMRLTTAAFGAMTMALRRMADECCGGRLVLVTEGGYDLQALAESLEAAVGALAGRRRSRRGPERSREAARARRRRRREAGARTLLEVVGQFRAGGSPASSRWRALSTSR